MGEAVTLLIVGLTLCVLFGLCDRGVHRGGTSWFDIPQPQNRQARRS